jgi:hypothetical protein
MQELLTDYGLLRHIGISKETRRNTYVFSFLCQHMTIVDSQGGGDILNKILKYVESDDN